MSATYPQVLPTHPIVSTRAGPWARRSLRQLRFREQRRPRHGSAGHVVSFSQSGVEHFGFSISAPPPTHSAVAMELRQVPKVLAPSQIRDHLEETALSVARQM
jgi:hypothetical protein